jgi:hypothetical protein
VGKRWSKCVQVAGRRFDLPTTSRSSWILRQEQRKERIERNFSEWCQSRRSPCGRSVWPAWHLDSREASLVSFFPISYRAFTLWSPAVFLPAPQLRQDPGLKVNVRQMDRHLRDPAHGSIGTPVTKTDSSRESGVGWLRGRGWGARNSLPSRSARVRAALKEKASSWRCVSTLREGL